LGEIVIELDELKISLSMKEIGLLQTWLFLSIVSGNHYLFWTTYSIPAKVFEI